MKIIKTRDVSNKEFFITFLSHVTHMWTGLHTTIFPLMLQEMIVPCHNARIM